MTQRLREMVFLDQLWGFGPEVVRKYLVTIVNRRMQSIFNFLQSNSLSQHEKQYFNTLLDSLKILGNLTMKLSYCQESATSYGQLKKIIENYEVNISLIGEYSENGTNSSYELNEDYETPDTLLEKFNVQPLEWVINQALWLLCNMYKSDIEWIKKNIETNSKKFENVIGTIDYVTDQLRVLRNALFDQKISDPTHESFKSSCHLLLQRFQFLVKMISIES